MKNSILILVLFLLFNTGFSQNSSYEYSGRFTPSIKNEKLSKAQFIVEIMPEFSRYFVLPDKERARIDHLKKMIDSPEGYYFYPQENYYKIIDFVSIEISAVCQGKIFKAQSTGNTLTAEQKNILHSAELGTDISIKIKFKYKDWAKDPHDLGIAIKEGEYVVTVVPEIEAEYSGGFKQLTNYLNATLFSEISETGRKEIQQALVKFMINEEGQVMDAKIVKTSTDPQIDKLILDAINKMPAWKPAENSKGIKIKQEYIIPFGSNGC